MCLYPLYDDSRINPISGKLVPIPCGRCKGCIVDRITLWTQRLTYEYITNRCSFVTFTYDDYHLPYNDGSVYPTARIKDLSNYFDSLHHLIRYYASKGSYNAEYCNSNFKYFAVSEYGEKSRVRRPHYHALIFGLDFLRCEKLIKHTWKYGYCDVGAIQKGGIRYVLKYLHKQYDRESNLNTFFDYGCELPSMRCSPGLGKNYFLSQVDNINKYGCMKIGSRFVPVPSYWKNKLFNYCDKNVYNVFLHQKQQIKQINDFAVSHGFNSYDDYMKYSRIALEHAYETKAKKAHEPFKNWSDMGKIFKYDSISELKVAYPSKIYNWLYS